MSIRIGYKGNIGNCLFQYVYARLLAERNEFHLQTPFPYQTLLQTTPHKSGKKYIQPKIVFDEPYIEEDEVSGKPNQDDIRKRHEFYNILSQKLKPAQYVLNGYFEYSELFNPYETLIKSYFEPSPYKKNVNDIVINIRLGDFARIGRIIDSDWYLQILEKESFNKLYIVGGTPNEPYLKAFSKFQPIIVPSDPVNDFHFIKSFDKIICSNSTYCWWAAFFSEASTIYTSDKWISPLLISCKNSICIKADYLKKYNTSFYYSSVQKLIKSDERLQLVLDGYITPSVSQIKQLVASYVKIIYNSIRNCAAIEPFTLQLNVEGICRFSLNFYKGGSWLSEGSIPLADCCINFADWKSFHSWMFFGLRDIINPYLIARGDSDIFIFAFNLQKHEKELTDIFDNFKRNTPFITYSKTNNVAKQILRLVQTSAIVTLFFDDQNNLNPGKLYICFLEANCRETLQVIQGKFRDFYNFNEIIASPYLTNLDKTELSETVNILNQVQYWLSLKGLKMQLFEVEFQKRTPHVISVEDGLRFFEITQTDYLILNHYIVEKRLNQI